MEICLLKPHGGADSTSPDGAQYSDRIAHRSYFQIVILCDPVFVGSRVVSNTYSTI
jgi:hypothetical protein